jgi:ribosomal protein L37E
MFINENKNRTRNDELIEALKNKGATNACSRCGRNHFEIVGESQIQVSQSSGVLGLALQPSQPAATVIVACSYCGNLSHHAIGILTAPRKAWI